MFVVTAILSCVIEIRGLFKSTKRRHFENVKFEALSARRGSKNLKTTPIPLFNHTSSSIFENLIKLKIFKLKSLKILSGIIQKGIFLVKESPSVEALPERVFCSIKQLLW